MHDTMMAHQRQRQKHLTCEPPYERSGKSYETVRLDELVEVDAQELHRDAEVASEIEILGHFDDMMLLLLVLRGEQDERFVFFR